MGFNYVDEAPDGTLMWYGLAICGTGCPANAAYYKSVSPVNAANTALNGRQRFIYFDSLDRKIREEYDGYDGNGTPPTLVKLIEYDNAGRVERRSRPFVDGAGTPQWITYTYDALDRVLTETHPDGSHTDTSHDGLETTQHAYQSASVYKETITVVDSRGQKTQVTDDNGQVADYGYDGFGNLTSVTLTPGHTTTMQYDRLGRKTQEDDPDKGLWTFVYNAAGERVQQTDAKSQVATMSYDKLGRLIERVAPDLTSNWYYDTGKGGASCPDGIGQLCEEETTSGYSRTYSYDTLARPSSITTTLDGTPFTASATYDAEDRVDSVTYPSGLEIHNVYTQRGFHQQVTNAAGTLVYWEATAVDAEDRVTSADLGNGLTVDRTYDPQTGRLTAQTTGDGFGNVQDLSYTYDWRGNVTNRDDVPQSVDETVTYDTLDRVTGSSGTGVPSITFGYSSDGNISSQTDVGSYTYSGTAVRPHAVTEITGTINATYSYDANGNMTGGHGRTLTWTSFDQPASITQSGQTTSFGYDTRHGRFKMVVGSETTYYLNPPAGEGLFYEHIESGSQTVQRHYLSVAGRVVAVVDSDGVNDSVYYWHLDVMGSLNVVTDDQRQVVQQCHYSPFGQRGCTPLTLVFSRGYTGHEHLAGLGLINMNGRLYEPQVGRFLSADRVVPERYNTQSYNRYSYVHNSPFRYTDPSGFNSQALENAAAQFVFGTMATGATLLSNAGLAAVNTGIGFNLMHFQLSRFISSMAVLGQEGFLANVGTNGKEETHISRRMHCVVNGGGCHFSLNPSIDERPWYYIEGEVWVSINSGLSTVTMYDSLIKEVAMHTGVDPDLIRAVMYYENTAGGLKDLIAAPFGLDMSIQPMNVHRKWAAAFGISVEDLRDSETNILIGARILLGIMANMRPNPTIAEIYTLYRDLYATNVNWRGSVVQSIYNEKMWVE